MFCLIASPLTNMFYSGLNLISTYKDYRFKHTIEESVETIKKGESIIIYPEDSSKGYLDQLEGFHAGFVVLCQACLNKGIDVPIYVAYYNKKQRKYMIDKPVMFSSLCEKYKTKQEIAKVLCEACNKLGILSNQNQSADEVENEVEKLA